MSRWPKYVPIAVRKARAEKTVARLQKQGKEIDPVVINGRKITNSFWGKAWCMHLEKFSDYENRLPRGRSYARNGSVCHLGISKGKISAMVSGSAIYKIEVVIKPLPKKRWQRIQHACAGEIGSLIELLQGRLSDNVMAMVCDTETGLFPAPSEIKLACNCPDWAFLCKHLAAVLYGVAARLDESPELLFLLRGVEPKDLISGDINVIPAEPQQTRPQLTGDLADVFGIEFDDVVLPAVKVNTKKQKSTQPTKATRSAKTTTEVAKKFNVTRGIKASHIIRLREALGIEQKELAELIGVSQPTVRKWERATGVLHLRASSQELLKKIFSLVEQEYRK